MIFKSMKINGICGDMLNNKITEINNLRTNMANQEFQTN